MAKRKKRLEKGIASLEGQIELHMGKKETALAEGNLYLAEYYRKEIEAKERDRQRKRNMLLRKQR